MNPRSLTSRAACAVIAAGACCGLAQAQQIFLAQDFNAATLSSPSAGASGDTTVAQACASNEPRFTHNLAPIGWTNDFCGMPTFACANPTICTTLLPDTDCSGFPSGTTDKTRPGKFEWEGWSVANRSWWAQVAGSQRRQEFTLSSGNCLVADADDFQGDGTDEADPYPFGTYNAFATTRSIDLTTADLATLSLAFASSWRPEGFDDGPVDSGTGQQTNNQTATIQAIYTVGGVDQAPVQIFKYDSDPLSPTYKPDATNEAVTVSNLLAPAGATAVKFRIGLSNARNDWWWAVDNFRLTSAASATPVWTENFDSGLTLQNPVDAVPSGCAVAYCGLNVLTRNFPNGFSFANNPNVLAGASDWRGWVLVQPEYHACLQGSGSEEFGLGTGLIAVANGDRFADLPNTNGVPLDTSLSTPSFDVSARTQDNLLLSFASSWRPDGVQTAEIFADYVTPSGTQTVRVLSWSSQSAAADFKPDAVNENVFVPLAIPAGTTTMSLRFKYVGGNNWWWAIDNIRVFQGQATVPYAVVSPSRTSMALSLDVPYSLCNTPWGTTPPAGWAANFVRCGSCTANPYCGVPEFEGWSFVDKDWWVQIQGNQRRLDFTKGTGRIAVADNDTWDDIPNGQSQFNAFVSTPVIPLPGAITDIALNFDSSWRPEAFDDGSSCDPNPAPVDVLSITALDANTATVTTAAAHNLVTGNYVDFTVPAGAATFQNPNATVANQPGRVRVTVTSPTTFTFPAQVLTELTSPAVGVTHRITRRNSNNQTAVVKATYTVGAGQVTQDVLRWDSDGGRTGTATAVAVAPSPFFKNDSSTNDSISLTAAQLQVPAGATGVKFEFSLINSRNDWWWAVDNLAFSVNGSTLLTEGFENVPNLQNVLTQVGPSQACRYFSEIAFQPGNLTVDNSGLVGCNSFSFTGFNAWATDAWAKAKGGLRGQFAAPVAFVSDFQSANAGCTGIAAFVTPAYSVTGANANSLVLSFRSGWQSDTNHISTVEYSFDQGANWTTALTWSPTNKSTTPSEVVTLNIPNTSSTQTVQFRFRDANSGWWAISQLELTGVVGTACRADFNQSGTRDVADIFAFLSAWFAGGPGSDFNNSGQRDVADIFAFLSAWFAGC